MSSSGSDPLINGQDKRQMDVETIIVRRIRHADNIIIIIILQNNEYMPLIFNTGEFLRYMFMSLGNSLLCGWNRNNCDLHILIFFSHSVQNRTLKSSGTCFLHDIRETSAC